MIVETYERAHCAAKTSDAKKPMTKFSATERKAVAVTFECIVAMFLQPKMINN